MKILVEMFFFPLFKRRHQNYSLTSRFAIPTRLYITVLCRPVSIVSTSLPMKYVESVR